MHFLLAIFHTVPRPEKFLQSQTLDLSLSETKTENKNTLIRLVPRPDLDNKRR